MAIALFTTNMTTLKQEREAIVERAGHMVSEYLPVEYELHTNNFMNYLRTALLSHEEKVMERVKREYIKEVLLDFHKSRLENKGYDFFFKLSTDLDALTLPITDETK